MARYIDADALYKDGYSLVREWSINGGLSYKREFVCLLNVPAADVIPVRRGKWIRVPQEEMFCCDQCGKPGLSFDEFDVFGYAHDNFCADCGADMRGGRE